MAKGRPNQDEGKSALATPAKTSKNKVNGNGNGANLGFEAQLFLAADKLRKNLEPSDYKHVALGLIFLKHISNAFEAKHTDAFGGRPGRR
jgi:type I restriction enzyme M protein